MEIFFGGNPLAVVLKLVIVCIITGIVLHTFGINPADLLSRIPEVLRALSDLGWDWVRRALEYFALGAIIVVPIWVVVRLLKLASGNSGRASRS
jgi:Family of unknown function (DUF6460)